MNRFIRKTLLAIHLYDKISTLKRYLTGEYSKYVNFYSQFVNEDDLCFDVGANVGRRTKVLLKLKARVVAIEPQAHCINILAKRYKNNNRVILVEKAIGEKKGLAEMLICDAHSLSSISDKWVESVKASGRYSQSRWEKTVTVEMTTLDCLIAEYGVPDFIKIDVEGYEDRVLEGLSQPIKTVCFEFTPEFPESAIKSVKRLSQLGSVQFNYCIPGKDVNLVLSSWVSSEKMCRILESLQQNAPVGDIYARFDI